MDLKEVKASKKGVKLVPPVVYICIQVTESCSSVGTVAMVMATETPFINTLVRHQSQEV